MFGGYIADKLYHRDIREGVELEIRGMLEDRSGALQLFSYGAEAGI